jgi:transcriptional regulator with XRE-family HTH domain
MKSALISSTPRRGRPKGLSKDSRSFGPLGDLIRNHRLERQLGLAEVARACDCSVQFISNIEHGRAPLPWNKVGPLAKFLGISREQLQTANLSIRSDFQSFVRLAEGPKSRKKQSKMAGVSQLISQFQLGENQTNPSLQPEGLDEDFRGVIQAYQMAGAETQKRFIKTALKMLSN